MIHHTKLPAITLSQYSSRLDGQQEILHKQDATLPGALMQQVMLMRQDSKTRLNLQLNVLDGGSIRSKGSR